jgi:hypothetical protein
MPDNYVVAVSSREADDDAKSVEQRYEEEFLAKARDRFKQVSEAETEYRELALEDLNFYDGDQWPDKIERQRADEGRPCLTINRLPGLVHAVSNEIRQQKPAPQISPVDDKGDIETADVYMGIMRHIERQSNAPAVRSYAGFYSIVTGRSYYRVIAEYPDELSFDQELYIRRIPNPFTVYMDDNCREPDCCDAKFCFIIEDLTEDAFKEQFPDAEVSSLEDFRSIGDNSPLYGDGNKIRVAEYFTVDEVEEPIVMLQDGSVMPIEQVPEGAPIAHQRMTKRKVVTWSKISGAEILKQEKWPGYYIPVVRVVGEEYNVDGKTKYVGMVRGAKDPQRMLNYWESAKTELIALAPKSPYIAAEGQLENHETEWSQANVKNYAALTYKPREVGGQLIPAPQRQQYEPPIQAISAAEGGAVDHLKATTGVYDPSLGNRSNETSGIAIRQRLSQGNTANYHFADQLAISINYEGKVLVDLIPKIYDRPGRVMRIIGEDDTEREVTLNQQKPDKNGVMRLYDLGAGRYDLAVDMGPSHETKRQESVESMTAFAQAAPQLLPAYADLYVKAMDWPGAQQIAERVRPPGVADEDGPQIPPQAMQQMQQLQQQNQELQAQLQQAVQMIQAKQVENQSREKIAMMDNQTRLQIAQVQAGLKQADIGSSHTLKTTEHTLKAADIQSREDISAADNRTKEEIALLNARVKAAGDQLKATVQLNGQEKKSLEQFDNE